MSDDDAEANPFRQTGGVRIGESFWHAGNATWPFARISITGGGIDLVVDMPLLGGRYHFPRGKITRLSSKHGLFPFNKGLRIEHDIAENPPFILFWTFNLRALTAAIEASGYEFSH